MQNSDQHAHQKKYFEKKYSSNPEYTLDAWKKTYISRILAALQPFPQGTLLDIGTGSGYVAIETAKRNKKIKVFACDLAPSAIRNIKKYSRDHAITNLRAFVCAAEELPLPDKSIDLIVANALLEHISDENKAIKEWKRILKANGKIFIVTPLKLKFIWPFFWPINILHDKRIGHLRRYDEIDLKHKFNLKPEKIYYSGHIHKFVWLMLSKIFNTKILENFVERLDNKMSNIKYGASNISIVLGRGDK
jgi:ubiquinone/menaquinone biosynthesis C-methylase UbiE